jgi:hypothetical protein
MLLSLETLVASARASTRPYRWLVKQSRCRACGNVHEREPVLMKQVESGWLFEGLDDGTHLSAPVVFEEVFLAWCEHCHSHAAQELTRGVRLALDSAANTTALAIKLQALLDKYERDETKERFHHA